MFSSLLVENTEYCYIYILLNLLTYKKIYIMMVLSVIGNLGSDAELVNIKDKNTCI